MALLCISYFLVVGAVLGVVGVLVEHALPSNVPRRWVWLALIPLSVALPILASIHHNGSAESIAVHVDRNWWDCSASYGQVTLKLWWLSVVALIGWGVMAARRIAAMLRGRTTHAVVDGVPITLTDSIGPATVGFWRSRVVVPRWVLTLPGMQRRYVLRHEDEHRRAHDARVLCIASIIATLMPWNLALWWQLRRLRLAVELDCDRRVVAALGDGPAYGELLLQIAQLASRAPQVQPAFLGQAGMLERRLIALVTPERRRAAGRLVASLAAAALLYGVLAFPHPDPANHAAGHRGHAASSR